MQRLLPVALSLVVALGVASPVQGKEVPHDGTQRTGIGFCAGGLVPLIVFTNFTGSSWWFEENDTPRVGEVFYAGGTFADIVECSTSVTTTGVIVMPPAGTLIAVDDQHPIVCDTKADEAQAVRRPFPCARIDPGPVPGSYAVRAIAEGAPGGGDWNVDVDALVSIWVPLVATRPLNGQKITGEDPCTRSDAAPLCPLDTIGANFVFVSRTPEDGYQPTYVPLTVTAGRRTGRPPIADTPSGIPSQQRMPNRSSVTVGAVGADELRRDGLDVAIWLPPGARARFVLTSDRSGGLPAQLGRAAVTGTPGVEDGGRQPNGVRDVTLRVRRSATVAIARRGGERLSLKVSIRMLDGRSRTLSIPVRVTR